MRSPALVLVSLGLATALACGTFDNSPFRTGTVRGQLSEYEPLMARVALVGTPGIQSNVDAEGRFELTGVPAGQAELFVVASTTRALRHPVTVTGGGATDVGPLTPLPAGYLNVTVAPPAGALPTFGQLSVEGTPFQRQPVDATGVVRVGPLPLGCYTLEATLPGFPAAQSQACVESVGADVAHTLSVQAPDDTYVSQGCGVSGCGQGLHCNPDGQCVECLSDAQCGADLSCRAGRCEGAGQLCAACNGDWQCAAGTQCEDLPTGEVACVALCAGGASCPQGFSCQGGRCLVAAQKVESCSAFRQAATACTNDRECEDRGIDDGVCRDGACSFECRATSECPAGFTCRNRECRR